MKATVIVVLAFLALQVSGQNLKCYVCTSDSSNNNEYSANCKLPTSLTDQEQDTCTNTQDICVLETTEDPDDNEIVRRYCASSADYNEEDDKCESYKLFGSKTEVCVCSTEQCNGAAAMGISVVSLVSMTALKYVLE